MKHLLLSGVLFVPNRLEPHELPFATQSAQSMRLQLKRANRYRLLALAFWCFLLVQCVFAWVTGSYWLASIVTVTLVVCLHFMRKVNVQTRNAERELRRFEDRYVPVDV